MVLDTSGSMSTSDRYLKLASSARNFITSIAVDGSYVGIVDFDSSGKRISGLTLIDSDHTRRQLAELVPVDANGGTCIGCGLEVALGILSEGGASPAGGLVLLITDGQDNDPTLTTPWKYTYVEENVVIDAVAFSNTAEENLIDLQEATGGKFYLQTDDPGSTGLYDAFLATMVSGVQESDRRITLYTGSTIYQVGETRGHGVYIDPTVGNRTAFDFSYIVQSSFPAVEVIVTSPSGNVYNNTYEGYGVDLTFKVISVKLPFAEPGLWSYSVYNAHPASHEIFTSISTYALEGVNPIIATSELSGSTTDFANGQPLVAFAEVRQGLHPIIRANVIATIERPPDANGVIYQPIELVLLDNGAGADVTRDDGIYSRFFTAFTGVGYYGIKININNDNGTAIILNDAVALPFSRTLSFVEPEELLKGNIPKIGNTTLLLPGMPVPKPEGEPAPQFTRGISGGSSRVPETPQNWQPTDDIIPPSKIVDLAVTSSSYDNGTATLEFSAPGDDLDNGNASYYIIRMSTSANELRTNYSSIPALNETEFIVGDIFSPGNFGDPERFVVMVDVPQNQSVVSYIFAMHAVDDFGNEGDMSNVVQATLRQYIPPPLTTTPPPPLTTEEVDKPNLLPLWITLGVVGGAVVLVLLAIILVKVFSKDTKGVKSVSPDTSKQHHDIEQSSAYNNNAYTIS
ncbi:putative calcium-activated chloride channel regulator 1-like [Apostichopus japonicus]|uniref:Putative calcium-activated chloride channel regulator 1-like n=1 Tax=Stichopus japonicus TaxID=307972 RepID=A0A2G8LC55_STIJA|nr:putative calcium-activated chloride channel regulator 1-like [Apostichopus japonicus]